MIEMSQVTREARSARADKHPAKGQETEISLPRPAAVAEAAGTHAVLTGSLRAAARLVALIADQVEAAEAGDARWVAWLESQRGTLRRELFCPAWERDGDDSMPEIAAGIARLIDQADAILAGRSEEEQRMHDWIDVLECAAFPALHESRSWADALQHPGSPCAA